MFEKQFATMELTSVLSKSSAPSAPFLVSLLIHGAAILLISTSINRGGLLQQNLIPIQIALIDVLQTEKDNLARKEKTPPAASKRLPSAPRKINKPLVSSETVQPERSAPLAADLPKEESASPAETKPNITATPAPIPTAPVEGGGSEAGAENFFGKGEAGILPGAGTAGGGGTAAAGLGRGSGVPGLPAAGTLLKTNREAKPLQTARAVYPPMALQMGLEGDVTLKIEVDPEGKVTKAEVLKSAGSGFDEAAMKAVQQSRFEPGSKGRPNCFS